MMQKKILEEIRQHALEESPKECVGFVVQNGRKLSYIRAENVHEDPNNFFRTTPDAWATAEDAGEIVRFIHSHPGDEATARPSDADIAFCNKSGITWGIYAPHGEDYQELTPEAPPLVGRAFVLGSNDCWGLIMDWHRLNGVELDDFRVNYPWWERGENLYMDNWQAAGFEESELNPGAMVVMQCSAPVANHAGIITKDGQLLHHMYGYLSSIIPYGGYFKDRTVLCVRHKNLPEQDELKWKN